jgi:hypothetical protein
MCKMCEQKYNPPILIKGTHILECIGPAENQSVPCWKCTETIRSNETVEKGTFKNLRRKSASHRL